METYKQFKGLLYLLIIAGIAIYLSEKFGGNNDPQVIGTDTATVRLLLQAERDKVSAEFWEKEAQELGALLNETLSKEQPIKQYYTGKKTEYAKLHPTETDRMFLNIFKGVNK